MSEPAKVLVWLPLPAEASWRGEGIAQTLESILLSAPTDIEFCLVVSGHHLEIVQEVFRGRPNIVTRSADVLASVFPSRTQKWERPDEMSKSQFWLDFGGRWVSKPLKPVWWLWNRIRQLLSVNIVLLQRNGLVFRGYDTIWLPTATLPFISLLRGRKIYSFWDPFVFEYNEFNDIQVHLIQRFLAVFSEAQIVTTQSRANKDYLTSVFGLPADRIKVVHNGAPDYHDIWREFRKKLPDAIDLRDSENMVACWPPAQTVARTRRQAFEKFSIDKVNQSKLYRLSTALNSRSKVILISTQYRPYKGFASLFLVLDKLLSSSPDLDLRFVFTASCPKLLSNRYPWYTERVYEITRVSRLQHAYLYAVSDLVLHPSLVEGGLGSYPQFEAASLNVPSLNNYGRHFRELDDMAGEDLQLTTADFSFVDETIEKIRGLLTTPELAERNIAATKKVRIEWTDAARNYADIFRDA